MATPKEAAIIVVHPDIASKYEALFRMAEELFECNLTSSSYDSAAIVREYHIMSDTSVLSFSGVTIAFIIDRFSVLANHARKAGSVAERKEDIQTAIQWERLADELLEPVNEASQVLERMSSSVATDRKTGTRSDYESSFNRAQEEFKRTLSSSKYDYVAIREALCTLGEAALLDFAYSGNHTQLLERSNALAWHAVDASNAARTFGDTPGRHNFYTLSWELFGPTRTMFKIIRRMTDDLMDGWDDRIKSLS